MRCFVSHHIVGEAGEDDLTPCSFEISEDESLIFFRIKRISIGERMRSDMDLMTTKAPANAPAQGELKPRQRLHHDRIDVLLMKPRFCKYPVVFILSGVSCEWIDIRTALKSGIIDRLIKNS